MTKSRLQKCIVTVYCVLMMFVLGASDALRGVFLPVSMLLLCLSFFLLRIRVPRSKEIL